MATFHLVGLQSLCGRHRMSQEIPPLYFNFWKRLCKRYQHLPNPLGYEGFLFCYRLYQDRLSAEALPTLLKLTRRLDKFPSAPEILVIAAAHKLWTSQNAEDFEEAINADLARQKNQSSLRSNPEPNKPSNSDVVEERKNHLVKRR